MVSFNPDTRKQRESTTPPKRLRQGEVLVWDNDRTGNRFIFKSQIVFSNISGELKSVPLTIIADTGASCLVFDLRFVEDNEIPWRK